MTLQELARDDELLDLARALADEQEGRVAVETLDGVLRRVPVPSVNSQRVCHDLVAHLGAEVLGHPRFEVASDAC